MGSGLRAAVTMGAVRQALRGAAQILAEPVAILDAADRALRSDQPEGIVTAFVAILDPITLIIAYASAGHPPPLLRAASGEISALRGSGLPLGLRAMQTDAPDITRTICLDASALLVLYTDRLIEATRDIDAGEASVREALSSAAVWNAENPAAAIGDHVLEEVVDDVAILAIRVRPARPLSITNPAGTIGRDARWHFAVCDQEAARAARNAIVALLAGRGATDRDTGLTELISELLGNVVRHCNDEAEFALDLSGEVPILHALDRGPGFTYNARLPIDLMSDSGRGLFIVRSLVSDLNITPRPDGGSHARAVMPFTIGTPLSGSRGQARRPIATNPTTASSGNPPTSSAASAMAPVASVRPFSSTMRAPTSSQQNPATPSRRRRSSYVPRSPPRSRFPTARRGKPRRRRSRRSDARPRARRRSRRCGLPRPR